MENQATSELDILYPNRDITVGGETVTVKEYTLIQQMQHNAKLAAFIATLRNQLASVDKPENARWDEIMQALADNYEAIIELVAVSINKPVEFVANLNAQEGEDLMLLWWAVNSNFFTRKAVQPLVEQIAQTNARHLIGAKS